MDNIPPLEDLFDPTLVSPIDDTLTAMRDYADADGSYPDVVSATQNLINELGSLLDASEDCASEAAEIKDYIQNYTETALVFNYTTTIDDLVVDVVDLAEDAVAFVNGSGREAVILVYNESTSGWSNFVIYRMNMVTLDFINLNSGISPVCPFCHAISILSTQFLPCHGSQPPGNAAEKLSK